MRKMRRRRIPYRKYAVRPKKDSSASFFVAVAALLALAYLGAATKAGTFLAEKVVRPVFEQLGVFSKDENPVDMSSTPTGAMNYTIPSTEFYFLQAGVYASRENAKSEAKSIQAQGGAGYIYQDEEDFRVILSAYTLQEDAETVKQRLSDTMELKVFPIRIEEVTVQSSSQEQNQAIEQGVELLMLAKDELFAANQAIETPQACKQHLTTARDTLQQAQSILDAQFSSGENVTVAELAKMITQALQDTEQAMQAEGKELNTKSQLALCQFLDAYESAINAS